MKILAIKIAVIFAFFLALSAVGFSTTCLVMPGTHYFTGCNSNGNPIPHLAVKGKQVPMLGFFVYRDPYDTNYDNVAHIKKYIDLAEKYSFTFVAFSLMWQAMDLNLTRPETPEEAATRIDWTVIDGIFDYAQGKGVCLMPLFQYSHCTWWWHLDPELSNLSMRNQEGGQHPANLMDRMPCFCCPQWWEYLDAMTTFIVERYRSHPALIGWLLAHGMSVENNYPGSSDGSAYGTEKMYDYSDFAVGRFREWLRRHYSNDVKALRTAWGEPCVTFYNAQPAEPMEKQSDVWKIYEFSNSPGDTRRKFLDWQRFRLQEKKDELDHTAHLIKSLDSEHVLLADPGGTPFLCCAGDVPAYALQIDYYDYASNPDIDGVYVCPGIMNTSWDDKILPSVLHLFVRYFHSHGKAVFVQFENWDLKDDGTRQLIDELWNYRAWAYFIASLGCGVTWATGLPDMVPGQDWLQAEYDPLELAEIARCAYLVQSLHRQTAPKPKLALIDSPGLSMIDYYEFVPMGASDIVPKGTDLLMGAASLSSCGLSFDILTGNEIGTRPQLLNGYDAVALLDTFRKKTQVTDAVLSFKQQGGGLALIGKTGIFNEFGSEDLSILKGLLGISSDISLVSNIFTIGKWTFNAGDPSGLVDGLESVQADTGNMFFIPKFDYGTEGYSTVAKLDSDPSVATVGYKDKKVFWFPKMWLENTTILPRFFANLCDYFKIGRDSVPHGAFCSGTNFRFLFTEEAFDGDIEINLETSGCRPAGTYTVFDISRLNKIADVSPTDGKLKVLVSLQPKEPKLIAFIRRPGHPFFLGGEWCALSTSTWHGSELRLLLRTRVNAEAKFAVDLDGKNFISASLPKGVLVSQQVYGKKGMVLISFKPTAKNISVRLKFK